MAQTTTVRIVAGGAPQAGVQVAASDKVTHWVATDANGELSMQFEDNEVYCSLIAVKVATGEIFTAHLVLEAGDTKEVAIGGG